MKETAVEWLEKIHQGQKVQPFDDYEWEIAFNHAKELEKEQIFDAYITSHISMMSAEQYYYETFKQQEQ